MRLLPLLPAALLVALLGAACAEEEVETTDIVSSIPWSDGESLRYDIFDEEGEELLLTGEMSATLAGDRFELNLYFEDDEGQSDESTILVDAETMKPDSVRREINEEDGRKLIEAEYTKAPENGEEDDILEIAEIDEDGDERTLPLRLKDNYYDNESSLYLWRTIPLENGYEADYYTVIAAQGVQHTVNVQVEGRETVEIGLGTFEAWLVEIRSESRTQRLWISDDPLHLVLQYDNSRNQLFQLTEGPEGWTP